MERTSPNPFLDDVFVDDPGNLPGVEHIHREVFSKVKGAIERFAESEATDSPFQKAGRTFLLTAPRAGYGKSHLIGRMRDQSAETATTLVLPFQPATPVSWSATFDSCLAQSRRKRGDTDLFTETGRHFLAATVASALDSGIVPGHEFPTDPERLQYDQSGLFSRETHGNIVDWTNERCHHLASESSGADTGFWARLFLDRELGAQSAMERCTELPENEARRKCLQFLQISASFQPVLLIVDGLEGFFSSPSAGLEIATIVAGIRDAVPRTITVLCLNEEVWDSVFGNKLPSAYLDRLTGENSRLNPITPEEAEDLIVFRLRRTGIPASAATDFSDRLAATHLWVDAETKLTPRVVLRQGRELWEKIGSDFAGKAKTPEKEEMNVYDVPLSELTDKAEFFADLQKNGLPDPKSKKEERPAVDPPAEEEKTERVPAGPEPIPENPFFAATPQSNSEKLDGIESIIRDIRGSGSSVISETQRSSERSDTRPVPTIQAGPIGVTPTRNGSSAKKQDPTPDASTETMPPKTVDRKTIDRLIQENHRELLGGPPLTLNLVRLGKFLKAVGENHPGLSQAEEHLPGARSVCLRWIVRGQSVLLGFESPQNVYFWNHLLQQSLSSNDLEKISAFSHSSQVFDSELFATFGFSPAVIRGRIDPIEMSDEELALLYAADSVLEEFRGTGDSATAMQHITQQLDPLWRRIGQAV